MIRIISGSAKGRRLLAPKNLPVRPTTDRAKEGLFNILQHQFSFENIVVLDLFSGTGNISYEFASRGVSEITAVEQNRKCIAFIDKTSEVLDFQFTAMAERFVDRSELVNHFGTVYAIGNIAALVIQLCFSIFAAKFPNYRIHWILLMLPLSVTLGSLFFIIAPILVVGSLLKIADSTFAYSVNQTGRETLYNPLSRQEKYVARAFVEVFVQRTGKVAALLIAFLVPMFLNFRNEAGHLETSLLGLQILGGFTCLIVALWFYCVKIVARKFEALEKNHRPSESQALGQAQTDTA